jgi:predicted ATP-grasp superfamily ATP-dependent carboligase
VRAREWAKTLADAVRPAESAVVVAAVDERDVDRGSDGYRGAYALDSTAMRHKGADLGAESGAEVRRIPPGTLVEGVAAATMARFEATGLPARLVALPAPSANRAGAARGPGFGGGIDPRAATHAVRMVMEATGLDFGVGEGEASNAFVGDDMRVYV